MSPNKPKVLIVDDIVTNIQVIERLLRKNGYDVAFTNSGPEAIKIAQHEHFDLILLDIMMPDMDGYEVCSILSNDVKTKQIPIIFLSARSDADSLIKGFNLGAVDFITKPFKAPELLARVKTHVALKQATEQLQSINVMKDKLLSIIAHDLRGPVGNFSSILEIVIENINTYDKQTLLETLLDLHNSSSKVFVLLENLLSWARNENENIDYNPSLFRLDKLILHNIEFIEHTAAKKQISFHTDLQENTMVFADKNMLDTVLRNLFTNAIKFSLLNARIEVSTKYVNNKICVSVRDYGVGIDEDKLCEIFNPDVYHSTFGTANEKGTGLGLKLCKDFIVKNGGEIFAESKPDHGSVFTFSLPIHDKY